MMVGVLPLRERVDGIIITENESIFPYKAKMLNMTATMRVPNVRVV